MVVRQVQDLVPWLLGLRDASERTPDKKQRRSSLNVRRSFRF